MLQKIPFPDDLRRRQLLLLCYVLFIAALSLAPSDARSLPVPHIDKVGHFLAYVLMAVLALISFEGWSRRVTAVLLTLPIAIVLEWGQSFVPGRLATLTDGITNVLGLLAGILLYLLYSRRSQN